METIQTSLLYPQQYSSPTGLQTLFDLVSTLRLTDPTARLAFTTFVHFMQTHGYRQDIRDPAAPLDVYEWPLEGQYPDQRCDVIVVSCLAPEEVNKVPYQSWFFTVHEGPPRERRSRQQQAAYDELVDTAPEVPAEQLPMLLYEAFAPRLGLA